MEAKIKLLEERVSEAVERLRTLSSERERMQKEVRALRKRLESLTKRGSDETIGPADGGWQARVDEIAGALQQAMQDLRGN